MIEKATVIGIGAMGTVVSQILASNGVGVALLARDSEPVDEIFIGRENRRYLPGVSALTIPLMPTPGELIGVVLLYRKGEQPFTDSDVALAELIAAPTSLAVRRND